MPNNESVFADTYQRRVRIRGGQRRTRALLRVPAWLTRPKSIFQRVLKSRPPIPSVRSGPPIITPVISCHIAHLTHALPLMYCLRCTGKRLKFLFFLFSTLFNNQLIGRINLNHAFNRFETSKWERPSTYSTNPTYIQKALRLYRINRFCRISPQRILNRCIPHIHAQFFRLQKKNKKLCMHCKLIGKRIVKRSGKWIERALRARIWESWKVKAKMMLSRAYRCVNSAR